MKKLITLLFVVGFTFLNAQNVPDRIEGFRDFKWGSHVDSIYANGSKVVFTPANKVDLLNGGKFYTINNENLTIGSIGLTNIYYVFSDKTKRLYKVILEGKKQDVEEMDFIVDYKYGENINIDEKDDKIIKQWIVDNVTITLKL